MLNPETPARGNRRLADGILAFMRERFDLRGDQAYEGQTLETVRKDVQFRGANLWILLFAILICSIGLNVNSPAVVIGAMLISPLMGPILGIGVGIGIYDFDLLLTALKNLAIATVASVAVSAAYFALSPITEAQSELLARVSPTLWDVLIATFGGFAGIIAVSRREKGNALPGVAIATALMPPICTAGYAIASAQWQYFAGSLYLFFINIVFIAVSTFVLVRFMRFTKHQFVDESHEKRVRRYILLIVAIVAVPSVYTAYVTVQSSLYIQRANTFIEQECDFEGAEIIAQSILDEDGDRAIELVLVGAHVTERDIERSRQRMPRYNLAGTELIVMQDRDGGMEAVEYAALRRQDDLSALYRRNDELLSRRDAIIDSLRKQMSSLEREGNSPQRVLAEAQAIFPQLEGLSYGRLDAVGESAGEAAQDRGIMTLPDNTQLSKSEQRQLARWLTRRVGLDTVIIAKQ